MSSTGIRSKWAAVGAAVAVSLGAGGIGITQATTSSGEKPIYLPIEPCRLADTRPAFQVGPRSAPLGPNETYTLSGHGAVGDCTLPTGTTALSLNVTALDATAPTFVSLFPAGAALPVASHLNPLPGQGPTPNAVNVDLNAGGQFSIYNLAGNVNIIIDVVGVFDDHTHDDRYYTETEVDAALAGKADIGDSYTKAEADAVKPIAAYEGGAGVVDGIDADTVVRSAAIDAPGPGTIVATATSTIILGSTVNEFACGLTLGTSGEINFLQFVGNPDGTSVVEVNGVRHFDVGPGTTTVNYVCRRTQGTGTSFAARPQLSLLFIPD